MEIVGRIVSRGDVTGLYLPFAVANPLPLGVYDVRRIMDEFQIVYVGKPAMKPRLRFTGLNLQDLFNERWSAAMTLSELKNLKRTPND